MTHEVNNIEFEDPTKASRVGLSDARYRMAIVAPETARAKDEESQAVNSGTYIQSGGSCYSCVITCTEMPYAKRRADERMFTEPLIL